MGSIRKCLVFLFVAIIIVSNLIIEEQVNAQAIPKTSVPDFTVKLIDNSYDVSPTTSSITNYYTNKTTTINVPGYHIQNMTIQISIKNQPYPMTVDGNKTYLIYQIQRKPHFANATQWLNVSQIPVSPLVVSSDGSGYTTESYPAYYIAGDQIDFRVQAILQYQHTIYEYTRLPVFGSEVGYYPFNVTDPYQTSEWSAAKTIEVPTATSSPNNSIRFSIPGNIFLDITAIIAVAGFILAITVLILYRRKQNFQLNKVKG